MADKNSRERYRNWYANLLRCYPKNHYERFARGMQQTFNDLLQERANEGKDFFPCALWMFTETSTDIFTGKIRAIIMNHLNLFRIVAVVAAILTVPLITMQFSDEVRWTLFDFVAAGVFLLGTGMAFELIARKATTSAHRIAVAMALAGMLLLVWINLAVGIIGTENNPANLMYAGVLGVGVIGALFARLQPTGMTYVLLVMAFAQASIATFSLVAGLWRSAMVDACFIALWIGSALLFRHAGGTGSVRPTGAGF